ncbi:MAG: GAF domain-containing protein [Deltaproteobacteria bacterium]|nr:GAF domain-containing protein [Deltaproteobacteria bacterium]
MLYSLPPLLTLLCYAALGLLTLRKGLETPVNRLLFCISLSGTFLYVDILVLFNTGSRPLALWTSRLDHCSVVFTIPLFMHFFRSYLDINGHKWLPAAAYVYAALLMPFAFTPYMIAGMQHHTFGYFGRGGTLYPLIGIGALMTLMYCLFLLGMAIHRETSSIRKNKLTYLCIGFGTMGMLNGLNVFPILGFSIYPPGAFSFIPLAVFTVGLLRYDLLDMGGIIKKSLLYSLLTASLLCVYSLMVIMANKYLTWLGLENRLFYNLVLFVIVATIFGPVKTYIQKALDQRFHREKFDHQKVVKKLGQTIISTLDVAAIARHLSITAIDRIRLSACHLFLNTFTAAGFQVVPVACQKGSCGSKNVYLQQSPLVNWLRRRRQAVIKTKLLEKRGEASARQVLDDMAAISVEIVLPLIFNGRLLGFIGCGQKKNGNLFSREEIDLLTTLAMQTTLAVENASSYRRLDELNKTLELRVDQRTRELQGALLEKEKTQEQLVRSESLASIGLLVAGTAHELNNPLASSISLLQSGVEELEKDDGLVGDKAAVLQDLRVAGRELKRAKAVVASLLGLSRQTSSYKEKVDLNAVIGDAVRVLRNQFKPACPRVDLRLGDDLPRICGNYASLGQVAVNILKNALQATDRNGGEVTLSTGYEPQSGRVIFSCEDSGPGVTPDVRRDMFKPFFTTKEVGEGTGLGLYISHEIVRKHNGSIHVESEPAKGTLFRIALPAALPFHATDGPGVFDTNQKGILP